MVGDDRSLRVLLIRTSCPAANRDTSCCVIGSKYHSLLRLQPGGPGHLQPRAAPALPRAPPPAPSSAQTALAAAFQGSGPSSTAAAARMQASTQVTESFDDIYRS